MNLYLISQTEADDYDTYDSAIVCACDFEDARQMHPRMAGMFRRKKFSDARNAEIWADKSAVWCTAPANVHVRLLGKAGRVARGVVLASFNAG